MKEYSVIYVCLTLLVVCNVSGRKYHYRAAVFEHNTHTKTKPPETLIKFLQEYETATRTASKDGADIIVFPEDGLYPANSDTRPITTRFAEEIPNPKAVYINPCRQTRTYANRPVLSKLSCLAKDNKIFIVANMIEFNKCALIKACNPGGRTFCRNKGCPDDGMLLYNTNVVFNRRGTLIAKYYKRHLFFETDRNLPNNLQDVFFETDFGKFTTFICFDLIFNTSIQAIKNSGVRNVAYPTYWYDQLPQAFFATPFQQAWAMANNVNLLAANTHIPGTGSLGSGIYSGHQGPFIYTDIVDAHSRLLISNVPRTPRRLFSNRNVKQFIIKGTTAMEGEMQRSVHFKSNKCDMEMLGKPKNVEQDYRCFSLDRSKYKYKKLTKPKDTIRFCGNGMCCKLSYETKSLDEDYFLGIVGKAQKVYNITSLGTEGCFFARCDSSGSKECKNFLLKSKTVFDYVELEGNYKAKFILPYAIDGDMSLTDTKKWKIKNKSKISYKNGDGKSSLLFLSLIGRHFNQDIDYDTLKRRERGE